MGVWAGEQPGSTLQAIHEPTARSVVVGLGTLATQEEQALMAGAVLGARALARRNGAREGKPVNQVLAAAITATEAKAACEQAPEPSTKPEPGAGEAEGHPS